MSPKIQPQVKVAEQTHSPAMNDVWYGALALFSAGVFYFFAYYFWGSTGGALAGG